MFTNAKNKNWFSWYTRTRFSALSQQMRLEGLTRAESEHVSNTHTTLRPADYIIGASILTIWGRITNIRPCAYTNNSAICLYISKKCQILSLHAGFHLWNWQVQAIMGHCLSISCSKNTSPSRRVMFASSSSPKPPRDLLTQVKSYIPLALELEAFCMFWNFTQ